MDLITVFKIYSFNAAKVASNKMCHMHNCKSRTPPLYPALFCLTHWHTYILPHNLSITEFYHITGPTFRKYLDKCFKFWSVLIRFPSHKLQEVLGEEAAWVCMQHMGVMNKIWSEPRDCFSPCCETDKWISFYVCRIADWRSELSKSLAPVPQVDWR